MPYDKAQAAAYQAQQYQNMKATLQNVMDSYERNPELIAELLEFKNRFYNYSINNTQLIYGQNPDATYVGSYKKWNEQGYHVRKGQKGIKIFVPVKTQLFQIGEQNGKKQFKKVSDATPEEQQLINAGTIKPFLTTRFAVGNVFDISQTDCPPEDYPKIFHMGYSSDQHAKLYDAVKAYAESKDHPVIEKDLQSISLRGKFFPGTGYIEISDKLNDTEKLSTLTHELGHALLHGIDEHRPTSIIEFEADCISIMLQKQMGIDLTDTRKRHFVEHFNNCKGLEQFKLDKVLKNVNAAYLNLRNELDPMIEQAMVQSQKAQENTINPEILTSEQKDEMKAAAAKKETVQVPEQQKKSNNQFTKSYQDYREQDAVVLNYLKHNVSILTVAEDMGFTPQQIGGYYTLKEHDSVRIYPDTNSFNRFSADVGGSTIDFAMHFGGLNQKEAIQTLKDKSVGNRLDNLPQPVSQPTTQSTPAEPKKFELPEKAEGKFARAYAYLTKTRCIDSDIVQHCMKDGLIYEDNKHNVVFVGNDEAEKPAYATRHTTLTNSDFKRDVANSRQDIGFMVNNKAEKLYVCEAPIDALSIMCLRKQQGQDCNKASYLATCGTGKSNVLYNRLNHNPHIKEVVLANDNDEAGQIANRKIYENLKTNYPNIKVSYLKPKEKDINEHLCKFCEGKCTPHP